MRRYSYGKRYEKYIKGVKEVYNLIVDKDTSIYKPQIVGWNDINNQQKRFDIFLRQLDLYLYKVKPTGFNLIDYGCGVGDLYGYMQQKKYNFIYTGVDVQENMVAAAREKHPEGNFSLIKDIEDVPDAFDIAIASGVFTAQGDIDIVADYFARFESAHLVMANFLTNHQKAMVQKQSKLAYYNADKLATWLSEEFGKDVKIIEGYFPDDFSLIMYSHSFSG